MVAWLITWEWSGDHAKVENKIALILRWRLNSEKVREIVEALYAYSEYSPSECVRYCAENEGRNNPYPARFEIVDGAPWRDRIYCGHNPFLYTRQVDDLHIYLDENGKTNVKYKERPIPRNLQKMLRGRRTEQ